MNQKIESQLTMAVHKIDRKYGGDLAAFFEDVRKQQERDAEIPKYTGSVRCTNCGYTGIIHVPKGTPKPKLSDCPRCECHTLRSGL